MARYLWIILLVGLLGLWGCTPEGTTPGDETGQVDDGNGGDSVDDTSDGTTDQVDDGDGGEVGEGPTITAFHPTSGTPGTGLAVTVCGTNLGNLTGVTVGEGQADILWANDTDVLIELPLDATTGPVTVVSPAGTAVSDDEFTVTELTANEAATYAISAISQLGSLTADAAVTAGEDGDDGQINPASAMVRLPTEATAEDAAQEDDGQDNTGPGINEDDYTPSPAAAQRLFANRQVHNAVRHGKPDEEDYAMGEVVSNLVQLWLDRYRSGKVWISGGIKVFINPDCNGGIVLDATDFEWLSHELPFTARGCVEGGGVTVAIAGTLHVGDGKMDIWFDGTVTKTAEQIVIDGEGGVIVGFTEHPFTCNDIIVTSGEKLPSSGTLSIGEEPAGIIEFTEETPTTGMVIVTAEGQTFEEQLPDPASGSFAADPDVYDYTGLWTTSSARSNPFRYKEIWRLQETGGFSFQQAQDSLTAVTQSAQGLPSEVADQITDLRTQAESTLDNGYDGSSYDQSTRDGADSILDRIKDANDMFDLETVTGLYLYYDENYPKWYTLGLVMGKAAGPRCYAFYTETTYLKPNAVDPPILYGQTGVLEMKMDTDKSFTVQSYPLFPPSNHQGLVLPWKEYCLRTGLNVKLEADLEDGTISIDMSYSK